MSCEYFPYDVVASFCGMQADHPFKNHLTFSQGSKIELLMNACYQTCFLLTLFFGRKVDKVSLPFSVL